MLNSSVETTWTMTCAMLIFFMQAGFAMLEVGSIRAKNAQNVLMKNIVDLCIAALTWYFIGYGFAFGQDAGQFIGTTDFLATNNTVKWMFQFAFSATSATIVSGSMAERTELIAYMVFTTAMTSFIYPVFAHWVWGNGWLQRLGFYDFAGSATVHMTGGFAALLGSCFLKPRKGRFLHPEQFKPHNVPLLSLGMLILWLGWYGFNAGSIQNFETEYIHIGNIFVNTSLSGATAGLVCLAIDMCKKFQTPTRFNITSLINGILAGMVAITGCSPNTYSPYSLMIGAIAGIIVNFSSQLVQHLKIDDPLDAFAVHGVAGLWGTIAVGFCSPNSGLFYGYGFKQLGLQFLGCVTNIIWVCLLSAPIFWLLKRKKWLRVDDDIEIAGIDMCEHGNSAYRTETTVSDSGTRIYPTPNVDDDVIQEI